jgi:oxygen-independent coproporphyrinogen-3 oxidase
MRKNEFQNELVETIYFGGGTPSILSVEEINLLIQTIFNHYQVIENPEITLEANPDDLNDEKIIELAHSSINRLSIGIQSFFEEDLKLMNRAHNAQEAKKCLETATQYFDNISLDLIYGIPGMSNEKWLENIQTALSFGIPHISSYALTVEPKTGLHTFIKKGIIQEPEDDVAHEHFEILVENLAINRQFRHFCC